MMQNLIQQYFEACSSYEQHLDILKNGAPKYPVTGELTEALTREEVGKLRKEIKDLGEKTGGCPLYEYTEVKKKWHL